MKTFAVKALGAAGLGALFLFTTAGLPTNGLPTNGLPTNGLPTNGLPTNGLPTNGLPTNGVGANLDALESSLLFANQAVHTAFIGMAFTQANITNRTQNPDVYAAIWFDGFSTLLASYLWQDAHAFGDDLVFTEPFTNQSYHFYGNVGLCDSGGATPHGWARDAALDDTCARWLSAMIITQVNQSGIHNLFSARGPSGKPTGFIGKQLTDMSPAMHSFDYKFGTHDPVAALHDACPPATTGPANCGWQPGFVGTGTPGTRVRVTLASTVPMLSQANQGIMGHDACAAGCTDPDVLAPAAQGSSVRFTVPPSGVFNVQWTAWSRADLSVAGATPTMTAQGNSGGLHYPADEVDIFPSANREMTAWGNIFGQANIDPALWSCEARLIFSQRIEGAPLFTVQLCDAKNSEGCTPCTRPFEPGGLHVIFPNAHLWLSQNWNSAQDYYQARSCSSDLSTCIATFEGLIDAFSFNAATGTFVPPCQVQSADRDSHRPLPYRGRARRLFDADGCFIGTTPQPFFDVTTFFPNYRDFGACAAIGPAAAASCAYTPGGPGDEDDDDGKDREKDDEKDDDDD